MPDMNGIQPWSNGAYPAQAPPPDPLPDEATNGPTPSYQLPRNIPAFKDAKSVQQHGRTLVLCLDGTGDKFDNDNSNIVHLVSCLKKDDKSQATYYQAGIGTYSQGGLNSGMSSALDMAVGSQLGLHVRDAYHFLMHTYKEGDKICLFGFSRGAYTARCVAGMVHKVGLLPPRNIAQIPFAYDIYKDDTPQGWKHSAEFKKTFCIDINVHFVGVFDSVASVGFIPRQLPLSSTPWSKSRYFRHAMALDERRSKFKVCRYQVKNWEEIEGSASDSQSNGVQSPTTAMSTAIVQDDSSAILPRSRKANQAQEDAQKATEDLRVKYEREVGHVQPFETDALEVWFAGCHADVGGGAVANEERHKLAQIPLRWMIRQTFECNTGIIFNVKALAEVGLDVHTLWPEYSPLTVPILGPPPSILEHYRDGLPPRFKRSSKLIARNDGHRHEHHHHHKDDDGFYDLKITEAERQGAIISHDEQGGSVDESSDDEDEENNGILSAEEESNEGEGDNVEQDDEHQPLIQRITPSSFFSPVSSPVSVSKPKAKTMTNTNPKSKKLRHEWLPEQVEDYFDAMSPMNDQLLVSWPWWILELWPVEIKVQNSENDEWHARVGMNLGRYRAVEDVEPKVHWTVRRRMENLGYKILARVGRDAYWKFVA